MELLRNTRIRELVDAKRPLVWVDQNATVGQCAELLRRNNILSIPVYDTINKKFIGILDSFSIMFYLAFGKFKVDVYNPKEVIFDAKAEYSLANAAELVQVTAEGPLCWTFSADDTVEKTLEAFCKGIHRAIVEYNGQSDPNSCRMITQTDLLKWICRNSDKFTSVLQKSLNDANLVSPAGTHVHSITEMQSALDGFRKMYIQGVSSVAVVSVVDGHLVANLSASDVRGVTSENVRDVQEPVMSFLTRHYQKPYHPVTSYASEKLYDVVLKMITAKVHRVWVVDAAYKPIGIVTISDILSKMHSFLK